MSKIYKSCIPGITDEQFKDYGCNGVTSFVSFERLMYVSIINAIQLKQYEIIKGMVIDQLGIQVYIDKK